MNERILKCKVASCFKKYINIKVGVKHGKKKDKLL